MKKLILTVFCLSTLAGCMAAPGTSDELSGSADEDLAESEEALKGPLINPGTADVVCTSGLRTETYNPGLNYTSRESTLTRSGSFGGCTSPSHTQLNSGTLKTASSKGFSSCALVCTASSDTIYWNDGSWSSFSTTSVVNAKPNGTSVVVSTGPITDGLFKGSQIEITVTLLATELEGCYTDDGVDEASGNAVLTIATPS